MGERAETAAESTGPLLRNAGAHSQPEDEAFEARVAETAPLAAHASAARSSSVSALSRPSPTGASLCDVTHHPGALGLFRADWASRARTAALTKEARRPICDAVPRGGPGGFEVSADAGGMEAEWSEGNFMSRFHEQHVKPYVKCENRYCAFLFLAHSYKRHWT